LQPAVLLQQLRLEATLDNETAEINGPVGSFISTGLPQRGRVPQPPLCHGAELVRPQSLSSKNRFHNPLKLIHSPAGNQSMTM
jgi:hypothetical protein